jgi:putative membrane protein
VSDGRRANAPEAGPPALSPSVTETRSAFDTIRAGLATALNVGPAANGEGGGADTGTRLAHERTDLAIERSYLAAERTLMAWIRTALSMISFGFTIGKLGQTLSNVEVRRLLRGVRTIGVESIAYFLVILGTVALAGAIVQYLIRIAKYADMGLRRQMSIPVIVGLVLVLLGAFAFTALVMQL